MMRSPGLFSPSIASSSEPASPEYSPGQDTLSAYKRKLQGMVGVMVQNSLQSQELEKNAIDFDDMESMLLGTGTSLTTTSSSSSTGAGGTLISSPNRDNDGRMYNSLGNASFSDGRYDDALQYYEMARAMYNDSEDDKKFLSCISNNIDVTVKRILKKAVESPGGPLITGDSNDNEEADILMQLPESSAFSPVVSPRHTILNRVVALEPLTQPSPSRVSPDSIADILDEDFNLAMVSEK